jgi:hypothetical protein
VGDSPASNVASATTDVFGDAYLSDLNWTSATVGWNTVQRDLNIKGNTISLRGTTYSKGIGTHAVSRITYDLSGHYGTFQSDIGIDDQVNGNGSVIFQVIGDGAVLFDSGILTGTSPVVHVSVSVVGVQTLTLVATNGVPNSIDYDHADWANAKVLAAAPVPTIPSAPANLTAAAVSTSQINLGWSNTTANQTAVMIEQSVDGVNFTPLATVAGDATSYNATNLLAGTTYYYRVHSTNSIGDSAISAIASATTTVSGAIYISDLNWTSATVGWSTIQKDLSIKSRPLSLRGTVYTKGIGTHADSTITYTLGGGYTLFQSDVGVDDETNGQGAVIFQVIGDGVVLYDSGVLTGTSAVAHINVDVTGEQQLSLVAKSGIDGSIDYAHADWANARLTPSLAAGQQATSLFASTSRVMSLSSLTTDVLDGSYTSGTTGSPFTA